MWPPKDCSRRLANSLLSTSALPCIDNKNWPILYLQRPNFFVSYSIQYCDRCVSLNLKELLDSPAVFDLIHGWVFQSFVSKQSFKAHAVLHAGLTSAIIDETLGGLNYIMKREGVIDSGPSFTVHLEVDYKKPIPSESTVICTANITSLEGRKTWVTASVMVSPFYVQRITLIIAACSTMLLHSTQGRIDNKIDSYCGPAKGSHWPCQCKIDSYILKTILCASPLVSEMCSCTLQRAQVQSINLGTRYCFICTLAYTYICQLWHVEEDTWPLQDSIPQRTC